MVSTGYPNTTEKLNSDLKSHLMMMIEDFKKVINNSLKEIENMGQEVEAVRKETHNPLKNYKKTQRNK